MNKINISSELTARMVNREATDKLAQPARADHIADPDFPGKLKPSHLTAPVSAEPARAAHFDAAQMARVDLQQLRDGFSLVHEFSPVFLREAGLYPYRSEEGSIRLAVADLAKRDAIEAVLLTLRGPVVIEHAAIEDIEIALESEMARAHAQDIQGLADADGAAGGQAAAHEDVDNLRDLASGAPVVQALDQIFDRAVALRATDIHIEPFKRDLRVRVRVDGILRSLSAPRGIAARALVSRVKILSGLNIAEHRLPQDGRTRINVRNREFDIRVATMPTTAGEAAILRLLERGTKLVEFSQIGFNVRDEAVLRRQLARPHGLLVVTGPTGSGKTTTLAAALATLNDTSRKILTIEDPVEYEIPGVNQSQVRPAVGLTFATALRAFLRQDPDVIMVGEVRDSETAKIAIQASLTGHLVLTTLHTNNAASAITRLVDVGVEPFLIASTLTSVLGQRLVRTLCPDCKQPFVLRAKEMDADPRFSALGFQAGATLHRPVGCERCGNTGYRGRVAIFEVLEITETIRRLILSAANDTVIEQAARAEGMTTMVEDGLSRCHKGVTTLDEVMRVAVLQ